MSMFRVIPAVDLKDSKCVQLRQGKEESVLVSFENPVEIAEMWVEKGTKALHIIDLSGAFGGKLKHEKVIMEIRRRVNAEIQVGGGIRDAKIIERLISAGIDRVIVGTMAVERIEDVKRLASRYPGRIMVAIDSRKDKVVVKGWKEMTVFTPVELARLYEDHDVSLLYTNVDVEGLMKGVAINKIRQVVENTSLPVYIAGGITTRRDVEEIKKVGAVGVVIGSALYTGKLSLEELLELGD